MKKLIPLSILFFALLSVSNQAYSKQLLVCLVTASEGTNKSAECFSKNKQHLEYMDIFDLVRNGWEIVAVVPEMTNKDGVVRETMYLTK